MQMVTRFPGGSRVDTEFGAYVVRTDQRRRAGGTGSAPTPFETFLAAIGACAGTYVLAFCRARGLASDGIEIVQSMETHPQTGMVLTVHLDIRVPPEFPERYLGALIRAAEQCTIKKHLESPPRIAVTTDRELRATG